MYIYLSKILPLVLLPTGLVLVLLCLAALLLWRGKNRAGRVLLTGALLLLWVSSTPFVAAALYGRLESAFPPVPLDRVPASGCVVVLGGAVGAAVHPRVDVELSEAVDRVYKAAQLFRSRKAGIVFVTAGNQPWSPSKIPEAEFIRGLLIEWGVPPAAIVVEGAGRNTRENALHSKTPLAELGCKQPLLVTSAFHMPRALAAFEKAGIAAVPVSTDVRVVDVPGLTVFDFLPQAGALAMTSDAVREWMGRKVYQWRGWN